MPSHQLPRFVPAGDPSTYTRGGLTVLAEFSRNVNITCAACKVTTLRLKLLSHSIIGPQLGDRLLTEHLDTLGWTRLREGGADICPECAATPRDICEFCRDYTGGHTKTCPTQFPGFNG